MRSALPVSILLTAVLTGCSSSSEPSPPPSFAVSPSQQWSGGTLAVRSSLFDQPGALPTVTAAGIAMAVVRMDDTTIAATLPTLPTQNAPIVVIDGSRHYPVGTVSVFGFRIRTQATPGFLWEPLNHTSASGGPVAIAGLFTQPAGGAIGIVDLRTAQTQVVTGVQPPQWANGHGVGASFTPGHLILRDSTGALGDWQVRPTLAYAAAVPSVTFSRQVARLADQVWMFTSNHATTIQRPGAPDIVLQQEDPWGFHLSTGADRALMNSSLTANGGSPVVQMSTGDTVYRLLTGAQGAAFSTSGITLYVVGEGASPAYELWSVDAATGTTLELVVLSLTSNNARLAGVGLSADQSLLFVGAIRDSVPEVQVFNAVTLKLAGRLMASASSGCLSCQLSLPIGGSLTVDDATGTVFMVVQGEPALIWEFDLLP